MLPFAAHHLYEMLISSPGWVYTGMTGARSPNSSADKPAGAWTAEQTVEYMVEKVFDEGDFYVICPDNDTTSVRSVLSSTAIAPERYFHSVRSGMSHTDRCERNAECYTDRRQGSYSVVGGRYHREPPGTVQVAPCL